jgi:hypothetical protein
MAKIEFDGRLAPRDDRKLVVEGKLYHFRTTLPCKTCNPSDRWMHAKQILNGGSDVVLECPHCETNITVKTVMAPRAE